MDHDFKFSVHINQTVCKALTRSNLQLKSFVSRDTLSLVKAFTVYVRPIVEYCSPVWSPHLIKDIEILESVQRKFTKRLPGLHNISYTDRLIMVGLERLDSRRLRLDLILTYKILFGLTCLQSSNFFTFSPNPNTRGHAYKLYVANVSVDTRKYFFSHRVVRVCNELPLTVDFCSLRRFKATTSHLDLTKYCIALH
mgnify:FL=1